MVRVATDMEAEGFDIPLLIGGATTSQVHTAVKIEPAYSGSTIYVPDASRAVGVVSELLGDGADAYKSRVRADLRRSPCRSRRWQQGPTGRHRVRSPQPGPDRLGPILARRTFVQRCSHDREHRSPDAAQLHRLDTVLPQLGSGRRLPAHSHRRRGRRSRPRAVRRCAADARSDDRRELDRRQRPSSVSGRQTRSATTSRSSPTARRTVVAGHAAHASSTGRPRRRSPELGARRLHRADRVRCQGLHRRLRRHDRHAGRATAPRPSKPTTTTTGPSWSRLWPTDSPRRAPSTCTTSSSAPTCGATRRRVHQRRPDQRALPGHPTCARLPGLSRPHREADDLRHARGHRTHRRRTDRVVRHDAGGIGQRPLLRPSRQPLLRRSCRSDKTNSRTTQHARASRSTKPPAGSPPCCVPGSSTSAQRPSAGATDACLASPLRLVLCG